MNMTDLETENARLRDELEQAQARAWVVEAELTELLTKIKQVVDTKHLELTNLHQHINAGVRRCDYWIASNSRLVTSIAEDIRKAILELKKPKTGDLVSALSEPDGDVVVGVLMPYDATEGERVREADGTAWAVKEESVKPHQAAPSTPYIERHPMDTDYIRCLEVENAHLRDTLEQALAGVRTDQR
jgi:hypothetical protein